MPRGASTDALALALLFFSSVDAQFSPLEALSTAAAMLSDSDGDSPAASPTERKEFAELLAKEGIPMENVERVRPQGSSSAANRGNKRRRSVQVATTVAHPATSGILTPQASPVEDCPPSSKVFVLEVNRNYENVKAAVDEHFVRSLASPQASSPFVSAGSNE